MHKDEQTGLVSQRPALHRLRIVICRAAGPRVECVKGHSVKCDGCNECVAVREAGVEARPARALDFGPVGDMEKLGERRGHRAVSA